VFAVVVACSWILNVIGSRRTLDVVSTREQINITETWVGRVSWTRGRMIGVHVVGVV
jgi:hypothetical protein